MGHTITSVRDDGTHWMIDYFDDADTDRVRGFSFGFTRVAVANRMGAYGFTDPRDAMWSLIHEVHWELIKPHPRDDPALIQGWVTSTDPDAERVHLYTAPIGTDASSAHQCRMDACASAVDLKDPDGLLPDYTPHPAEVRFHRELTDTFRWEHIYGGLPVPSGSQYDAPALEES